MKNKYLDFIPQTVDGENVYQLRAKDDITILPSGHRIKKGTLGGFISNSHIHEKTIIWINQGSKVNNLDIDSRFPIYILIKDSIVENTKFTIKSTFESSIRKVCSIDISRSYLKDNDMILDESGRFVSSNTNIEKSTIQSNNASIVNSHVINLKAYTLGLQIENIFIEDSHCFQNTTIHGNSFIQYKIKYSKFTDATLHFNSNYEPKVNKYEYLNISHSYLFIGGFADEGINLKEISNTNITAKDKYLKLSEPIIGIRKCNESPKFIFDTTDGWYEYDGFSLKKILNGDKLVFNFLNKK